MQVEGELRAILLEPVYAFQVLEALRIFATERFGEDKVYVPEGLVYEVVRGLYGGQLALADDSDPVADSLDLVQGMRGEEDGPSLLLDLPDNLQELFLNQRVEAAGGLVEDQKRRLVEHGLYQPDLLLVAPAEAPHRALEIRVYAISYLIGVVEVLYSPQTGEELQELLAGHPVLQRELTG